MASSSTARPAADPAAWPREELERTGLIYLLNRYYEPATGQFLSADPEVLSTHEPYGYAYGDPVIISDPTGLAPTAGWSGMSNGAPSIYNWYNDTGCEGYFVHYPDIMSCAATAEDQWGHKQPLREGYYNPEADAGFGREKAFQKHNLWVQPILDTIHFSHSVNAREKNRVFYFHVFHQDGRGGADQEVTVLITTDTWYGSVHTPDRQRLGVMTAFCSNPDRPNDPIEPECPEWVNTGPNRV